MVWSVPPSWLVGRHNAVVELGGRGWNVDLQSLVPRRLTLVAEYLYFSFLLASLPAREVTGQNGHPRLGPWGLAPVTRAVQTTAGLAV